MLEYIDTMTTSNGTITISETLKEYDISYNILYEAIVSGSIKYSTEKSNGLKSTSGRILINRDSLESLLAKEKIVEKIKMRALNHNISISREETEIKKHLGKEDQLELLKKYRDERDTEALSRLVETNIAFIHHRIYNFERVDFLEERQLFDEAFFSGVRGLFEAADKYNFSRKTPDGKPVSFPVCAGWYIYKHLMKLVKNEYNLLSKARKDEIAGKKIFMNKKREAKKRIFTSSMDEEFLKETILEEIKRIIKNKDILENIFSRYELFGRKEKTCEELGKKYGVSRAAISIQQIRALKKLQSSNRLRRLYESLD